MVPKHPKIYHIVHVDRLASILASGGLLSDAEVMRDDLPGSVIGMNSIKQRRLKELLLASHLNLHVGECVPFYFCPRSIMLYIIHVGNHAELDYRGGQDPIIHLRADLHAAVRWADNSKPARRWVFTLSNAGSLYFEDVCDLNQLSRLDWGAISAKQWQACKEQKQAEFLVEQRFPWELVESIGVKADATYQKVQDVLSSARHRPQVSIERNWYY